MTTTATPPPTMTHDSSTCRLGPEGDKCEMCVWVESQRHSEYSLTAEEAELIIGAIPLQALLPIEKYESLERLERLAVTSEGAAQALAEIAVEQVEQSAAAIRARRAALLERADAHSPTEGAVVLAEAYLDGEEWFQRLPNNVLQDAEAYALAKHIDSEIDNWLTEQQRLRRSEWSV